MATPTFKIEKKDFISLRVEFVDKLNDISSFMDHAVTVGLLRKGHYDDIMSINNDRNRIRQMLDFVERKLPSKSYELLEALIKSGNTTLAEKLAKKSDLEEAFNVIRTSGPNELYDPIENFEQHLVNMVNYMSDINTFIDYALVINLLSKQDQNDILSEGNVDNQIRKIYKIMGKKLPEESTAFLYALTKSGNEYLVDLLLLGKTFDFSDFKKQEETVATIRQNYDIYPMKNRGRVLIIENVEFDNDYDRSLYRHGSKADREALQKFFCGFEIVLKQNLTAKSMEKVLKEEIDDKKGDHEDCFILFFLSHGKESEIYGTDLKSMNYSVIFKEFNNSPIWKSKPKLIYIQACQKDTDDTKRDSDDKVSTHIFPGGHFYIMYATIPGDFAQRNTVTGSRLIQCLIEVYNENYLKEDVETMGIKIKERVYKKPDSKNIQIAECHSTLPKRLFLYPA